jgi:hypothetical protein
LLSIFVWALWGDYLVAGVAAAVYDKAKVQFVAQ